MTFPMISTLLFCDTETNSLPEDPNARLVEIGCVWWSVDLGVTLATWSELVEGPSNEAIGINKIPVAALGFGLPHAHAMEAIRSRAARADLVICHRVEFDRHFLGDLGKPYLCSKFDVVWPGVEPGASLLYTAVGLGVPVVEQHRALTDCVLLAKCFERVYAKSGPEGVRALLAEAMRPKKRYAAVVDYADRDKVKSAGFQWDGKAKRWWKRAPEVPVVPGVRMVEWPE